MRMNIAAWNMVHNFKMAEFNEPMMMDQDLMFKLDTMRTWVGRPFIIHVSYATEGHSEDSTHYYGKAVDGHFEGLTIAEQYVYAEAFNWQGLGVYPYWHKPGIHVDNRLIGPTEKAARWWRDRDGTYKALLPDTVKELYG